MRNIIQIITGMTLADMDLSWMKHAIPHAKYSKPPSFNRLSQKGRRRRLRQERSHGQRR